MSIGGLKPREGRQMNRELMDFQYSMKYWHNRIWVATAVICAVTWSCAQWKAEDRYRIGPDPTIPVEKEVATPTVIAPNPDELENAGYTPEERQEIEKEHPTSFIKALPKEELVEASLRLDVAPPNGVSCAIQYWELVWQDLPIVMV